MKLLTICVQTLPTKGTISLQGLAFAANRSGRLSLFGDLDTSPNGHNVEWTQHRNLDTTSRNKLLHISPKLDISPNFLIGRNVENEHNAEIETNQDRWTQRRNLDTTSKRIVGHIIAELDITHLLDATSKMDTTSKSAIEHIIELRSNVEKQKLMRR
ncbi:hypothetical protein FQR65_LT11225 [Abscondita terminalis]|nr:hypothetical protein FQR65_LT11225 [Abscondita terminalis]